MTVSIDIPDDLERRLRAGWADLPRRALEAVAIEAYRTQALTTAEVGRLLGFESRWEVEAFLSRGRVPLDYGEADLRKDVASIRTARGR
jgi:predicted HTH domain antitoxin